MVAPTATMVVTVTTTVTTAMTSEAISKGRSYQGRAQQHNKNSEQAFHGDHLARCGSNDDIVKDSTLGCQSWMTAWTKNCQISAVGKPLTMVTHRFALWGNIAPFHGSNRPRRQEQVRLLAHPSKPAQAEVR
jgi:hypothetical protein